MAKRKSKKKRSRAVNKKKTNRPSKEEKFPVVGIGASAGGIKAIGDFLERLSAEAHLAVIIVIHLKPGYKSILVDILSKQTKLSVGKAVNGTKIAPGHIYVTSPGKKIAVSGGKLEVTRKKADERMLVDHLFRSLADDQGERAVAVLFSGTGTDGTAGIKAVKKKGGFVFAQDEKSAEYFDMPRSAFETGLVDQMAPPSEIARKVFELGQHPYISRKKSKKQKEDLSLTKGKAPDIFSIIQKSSGMDFSHYKTSTVKRRIARRMAVHGISDIVEYKSYLQENREEAFALYDDLLISVTSFFREKKCFDALKKKVFPKLLEDHSSDEPIRVWTPGCSSGEETYSLAIALMDFIEKKNRIIPVQVFGTDLSPRLIEQARRAHYSHDIARSMPKDYLRRYFTKTEGGYKLKKEIRSACVFARHDLVKGPPLSNMDIVSCRNVLIYFDSVLQRHVIPMLHYALKTRGVLVLGSSESLGKNKDLFTEVDKKGRIFRRKEVDRRALRGMEMDSTRGRVYSLEKEIERFDKTMEKRIEDQKKQTDDMDSRIDRIFLEKYSPAGVLLERNLDIVQFRGRTSLYLEPSPGKASLNLSSMAREGLLYEIKDAIKEASKMGSAVRKTDVGYTVGNESRRADFEVQPVGNRFLVIFEPGRTGMEGKDPPKKKGKSSSDKKEVSRLRREITALRNHMQSAIEEKEAANEELRAANEEIQSSNEELQSMNEELETAKEELQSTNEELFTVNEELQNRNKELSRLNNDLNNIYNSINIPIIMMGSDFRVKSFTPESSRIVNLLYTDIGRSIEELKFKVDLPDLRQILERTIDDMAVIRRQLKDAEGRWCQMTVRPYRTTENKIDGVVMVFTDIDELKKNESRLHQSENYIYSVLNILPTGVIIIGGSDGKITFANRAARELYGLEDVEGLEMDEHAKKLGLCRPSGERYKAEELPATRSLLKGEVVEEEEVLIKRPGREITASANSIPIYDEKGNITCAVASFMEITFLKEAQEILEKSKTQSEKELVFTRKQLDEAKRLSDIGALASIVAHELRNPLCVISASMYNLKRKNKDPRLQKHIKNIEKNIQDSEFVISNLLNYSRINPPEKKRVDIAQLLKESLGIVRSKFPAKKVRVAKDYSKLGKTPVQADPQQITQVFTNLLNNAFESVPDKKGRITVKGETCELEGEDAVCVNIRDNGPGVPEKNRERIFEPFFSTRSKGTGLGLAVSAEIVGLHKGRITLGKKRGKGASFTVTLPKGGRK
ncbi:MAG: PAS domain S-box protein [Candidatus Omnitrophica bacterium]|nr:PAS domain S-box protein [Candidatus Omnitrophota bacterium]